MTVVNKIKQLLEVKIPVLILLARDELHTPTDTNVAKWIIAHSPYWRNQGYNKIIEEMNNART